MGKICLWVKYCICETPAVNTEFFWRWGGRTLLHLILLLRVLPKEVAIGERIRFYRQKSGKSIDSLAQESGISRYTLMRYEEEKTEPDLDALRKIAAVLNIEADKLFDEYYEFLVKPFSTAIKAMRKEIGLTQQEFGELFGVHRKTVLRWERGQITVTRPVWEKIKNIG